jgi:COP9 signalosome complex subunit 1
MLEQQNYAHVSTYVFKAEAALDIPQAGAEKEKEKEKKKTGSTANPEREKIQSKLDLALGLSMLGQSNYERAAWSFLKVGKNLDDWIGKVRCLHVSFPLSNKPLIGRFSR